MLQHDVEAPSETPPSSSVRGASEFLAEQICRGFVAHDRGDRETAIESFRSVDEYQFPHVDDRDVEFAAEAMVDALWAKDDVELRHFRNGTVDRSGLRDADWSPVRRKFRERAALLGIEPEYAELKTTAWRRHKTGGDYWTPFQKAQVYELRAALQGPEYPAKPKEGQSGFGPEAVRYALAVELHDMHAQRYWKQAKQAMIPYFERIVTHHTDE